eukprot:NODE_459_length_7203_cov_0.898226.p1 type:complete len:408 gc:universal NODE_459_length_7203_cov_0.898226:5444-4221(-)
MHFPIELRDEAALYLNDVLTAVVLKCSFSVIQHLSVDYFKENNVCEYIKLSAFDAIHDIYNRHQLFYNDLYPILQALIHSHEFTNQSLPTFMFSNHLRCLKLLHSNGYEVEFATLVMSIKRGSIECLDFILSHFHPIRVITCKKLNLLNVAVESNDINKVQLIMNKLDYPFTEETMGLAAKNANLEMMQFLHLNKCPLSPFSLEMAVEYGNIFHCKYLKYLECPFDASVFNKGVKCGKICFIKCLKQHGCEISENVMEYAVQSSIEMVEYLLAEGFEFTKDTFKNATNLEMMEYLLANGCPFSKGTFKKAVERRDLKEMQFLYQNNCPIDKYSFASAVIHNNLDILEYLNDKCEKNTFSFEQAALFSDLETIKWLHLHKYPYNLQTMLENAQVNEHVGVYLYIKKHF